MLPLDMEQRPIPTFHRGAKKDTVWHCSKPDRKKKKKAQFMLIKAMGFEGKYQV